MFADRRYARAINNIYQFHSMEFLQTRISHFSYRGVCLHKPYLPICLITRYCIPTMKNAPPPLWRILRVNWGFITDILAFSPRETILIQWNFNHGIISLWNITDILKLYTYIRFYERIWIETSFPLLCKNFYI